MDKRKLHKIAINVIVWIVVLALAIIFAPTAC